MDADTLPLATDALTVAAVIQLSVAPVFLLAGVGAILNVMTQRLARVIDRARKIETLLEEGEGPEETRRHRRELAALSRRMTLINGAIGSSAAAALAVCSVVALLFVGDLLGLDLNVLIAILFVATMGLLMTGLTLLLLEISVAMGSVRVRTELLMDRQDRQDRRQGKEA